MASIEWAMWANEQALVGIAFMFLGGGIGVSGYFHHRGLAVYALITSVILFILEYPRSKRQHGKTYKRLWQHLPAKVVNKGGSFTKNYYWRFVLHLICSLPLLFQIPLVVSGLCELIASAIYFSAAYHGEKWVPMTSEAYAKTGERAAERPTADEEQPRGEEDRVRPQPAPRIRSFEEVDLGTSRGSAGLLASEYPPPVPPAVLPRRTAPTPYEPVGPRPTPYENVGLRTTPS